MKINLILLIWRSKPLLAWVSWRKAKRKVVIASVEKHFNSGIWPTSRKSEENNTLKIYLLIEFLHPAVTKESPVEKMLYIQ